MVHPNCVPVFSSSGITLQNTNSEWQVSFKCNGREDLFCKNDERMRILFPGSRQFAGLSLQHEWLQHSAECCIIWAISLTPLWPSSPPTDATLPGLHTMDIELLLHWLPLGGLCCLPSPVWSECVTPGSDGCIYRRPLTTWPHRMSWPGPVTRGSGGEFLITEFNGTFSPALRHQLWLIQTRKLLRRDSCNMTKSLLSPESWRVFVPIVCIKTKWQEIKSITT